MKDILGHSIISRYKLGNGVEIYVAGGPGKKPHELVPRDALAASQRRVTELEAALDFNRWSETQVDAVRGLLVYYLGGSQQKWSLRDHMRAGGYQIPLRDGEDYHNLPKNLVAHLVLRIAAATSVKPQEAES